MQTNTARENDYDQPRAAGNTRTAILSVDDDTTARLTIVSPISNEDVIFAAARTRRQCRN
jgi:hypothetical protein